VILGYRNTSWLSIFLDNLRFKQFFKSGLRGMFIKTKKALKDVALRLF
jgi:hypothetical protein